MASSKDTRESHVKVDGNRVYSDNYCGPSGERDAGEGAKRRRRSHDHKKLMKLGYGPSMSNESGHTPSSESRGIFVI